MSNGKLLWVDDEIDLLKAHIIFLEKRGYDVTTRSNGADAVALCREKTFDLILLDEMMPGMTGLETLQKIKDIQPATPVVMVTKSEEEDLMNQAIGSKIADYLIKPVNPNQILIALKKNIHKREIVTEVTQSSYRQDFQNIALQMMACRNFDDWVAVYRRLVKWELELSTTDSQMTEMLQAQKEDADNGFAKYIQRHYMDWMSGSDDRPLMSNRLFQQKVFPLLNEKESVFLIVIDNFRYDQWRMLADELSDSFDIEEQLYMSILPTATQYARNAIFSGLMPDEIQKMFPDLWVDEGEEEGKNLNEEQLIATQIQRYRRHDTFSYHKINDSQSMERLLARFNELLRYDLNVVVVNFIDMLSHTRTESRMMRELANNESAYRSITQSWLRHSEIAELFRILSATDCKVVVTTDHGCIRTNRPLKIIGDRNTNTNLRYKLGKNLTYDARQVFEIRDPHKAHLPAPNLSSSYVFATGNAFFAYPNNYNYYVSYYKDTFQHGGISMEEMLIPIGTMRGKAIKTK
ncbi:MAG: PglZ domain-containing protein [Segatella maculosa]|jgi:response regulator